MFRFIHTGRWLPALGCWLALTTAAANITGEPLYRQALEQLNAGDLKGAHRLFRQLEENHPADPALLNNLGIIAARLGQFDRAVRLLEKAIATNPAIATSHRNLRALYTHRAAQAYKRALALDSVETAAPQYEVVGAVTGTPALRHSTPSEVVLSAEEIKKPLIEEPAPPARQTGGGDALITASLRRWAQAWTDKNLDGYFASYSNDYQPRSGADHAGWRRQRRERILGPQYISVKISNLSIRSNNGRSANVVFEQEYRSNLLSSTVVKRVSLKNTGDGWKITRERVIRRQ